MEKIQPGKYVELIYDLYEVTPDGEEILVHQVDPSDPEKIIFGVTPGVIQPLERALIGLEAGETYSVFANAFEAFGEYDPEQVLDLDKSMFEIDGKFDSDVLKLGEPVPMLTADGFRVTGIVKAIGPEKVKMDFNHPLAGKNVRFKGSVKTVREATPDELKPVHGCGCGGCHDEGCDHDGCEHDHCGNGCCH